MTHNMYNKLNNHIIALQRLHPPPGHCKRTDVPLLSVRTYELRVYVGRRLAHDEVGGEVDGRERTREGEVSKRSRTSAQLVHMRYIYMIHIDVHS
jgi:hypothetical protein